jgi:hypothetical protein
MPEMPGSSPRMAPRQPDDGEPDELEEQQRTKDDEVLEREGLETELMEHDDSEAGEDIHHAG